MTQLDLFWNPKKNLFCLQQLTSLKAELNEQVRQAQVFSQI